MEAFNFADVYGGNLFMSVLDERFIAFATDEGETVMLEREAIVRLAEVLNRFLEYTSK